MIDKPPCRNSLADPHPPAIVLPGLPTCVSGMVWFAENMKRHIIMLILAIHWSTSFADAQDKPIPELFQQLVTAEGADYTRVRDELVVRADKAKPFLNHVIEESVDWRQKLAAKIMLGWIDNSHSYTELWTWRPSRNMHVNPFPYYCAQARARFTKEGDKAIPMMLELIWKKGETHCGALPSLLADAKVDLAIPVLVRSKAGAPEAIGQFGKTATPYILEVLRDAEPTRRSWLVQALGLTGDQNAVSDLRVLLRTDGDLHVREMAALALGQLDDYATLRAECFSIDGLKIRVAILKALGKDKSDQTRDLLVKVATTAPKLNDGEPYNTERIQAIQALLNIATNNDIAAVCQIAPEEPDEYTRACMYLYLSRPGVPLVREALLKALKDPGPLVRLRAIEGLKFYNDETVTLRVLEVIQHGDDQGCRRAGVFMLKDRVSPIVREAAATWLKDKDPETRKWASEVLAKNPDASH